MLPSSMWCLSFKFPHKNPVRTFLPHACYKPRPPHLPSLTSQTIEFHFHTKQWYSNYCCHMQQADTTFVRVWNSELPGTGTLRRSAVWQEDWHLGTGLRLVWNDGFEESIWSWSKYQHVCVVTWRRQTSSVQRTVTYVRSSHSISLEYISKYGFVNNIDRVTSITNQQLHVHKFYIKAFKITPTSFDLF